MIGRRPDILARRGARRDSILRAQWSQAKVITSSLADQLQ